MPVLKVSTRCSLHIIANIPHLDIHMLSPPLSPTMDLQGASRITGGILRGRALGNVYNNADADLISGSGLERRMGRVQFYTSPADPTTTNPDFELDHEVTPRLTKVLRALVRKYSPVRSKGFHFIFGCIRFYLLFFR